MIEPADEAAAELAWQGRTEAQRAWFRRAAARNATDLEHAAAAAYLGRGRAHAGASGAMLRAMLDAAVKAQAAVPGEPAAAERAADLGSEMRMRGMPAPAGPAFVENEPWQDALEHSMAVKLMLQVLIDHLVRLRLVKAADVYGLIEALYQDKIGAERLGQYGAFPMEEVLDHLIDCDATPSPRASPKIEIVPPSGGGQA